MVAASSVNNWQFDGRANGSQCATADGHPHPGAVVYRYDDRNSNAHGDLYGDSDSDADDVTNQNAKSHGDQHQHTNSHGAAIRDLRRCTGRGWTDQTWDASVDLAQTSVVHAEDRAVAITVQSKGAWAPKQSSPVHTAPYANFSFYIHGGTTGCTGIVAMLSTDSGDTQLSEAAVNDYVHSGQVVPGQWRLVTIPLTALGAESKLIDRFAIHDDAGSAQPTFDVDDVRFDNVIPEPPPGGQHRISVDQEAHETYGLHYPVTYMLSFPLARPRCGQSIAMAPAISGQRCPRRPATTQSA